MAKLRRDARPLVGEDQDDIGDELQALDQVDEDHGRDHGGSPALVQDTPRLWHSAPRKMSERRFPTV